MVNLDQPDRYPEVDASDALADVESSAEQWASARALAAGTRIDLADATAVLVLGMGGSGISGDVVATIAAEGFPLPVLVHKGYGLPAWVGPQTILLAASYSGATEETVSVAEAGIARGARLLAVTTGGDLGALAEEHGRPWIALPPGRQPRHSLGYLAGPLLVALGLDAGLDEAIAVVSEQQEAWSRAVPTAEHPGKALALRLADGTVPIAYGAQGVAALAAARLGNQLNENAKLPALHASLPELCHNAIVGWEGDSALVGRAGVVWVRDRAAEHPRNRQRVDLVSDVLGDRVAWQETLESRGHSPLARLASLVHQADLVSVYTALARGVDPTPIASIERLKAGLGRALTR